MTMTKKVNYKHIGEWNVLTHVSVNVDGSESADTDRIMMATLCVIRDELKKLNALLHCHNFVAIPQKLDAIKRNTIKKRKPKLAAKPRLRAVS